MLKTLATAGAMTLVATAALAETVNVTPAVVYTLDIVEAIIGLGITAARGALAAFARPFLGDKIVESASWRLERAGRRAVTAGRMRYLNRTWTIDIENELIADVANYMGAQLPDAARAVGLTPKGLQDFAARLLGEEIAALPAEERPAGYVGAQGLT